ncbi:MAG: TetR family transcriptional regulator [Alphaproteobacteria bacterium]|nr:TetR family transcriptional regulator [Alphaproteobacteria bacterium]
MKSGPAPARGRQKRAPAAGKPDRAAAGRPAGTPKSERTRQLLIRAAICSLADFGFAETTMSRIATLAGVSAGHRQYHFPDPLDLFRAVVDTIHERWRRATTEALEARGPVRARVEALFELSFANIGTPDHMAMLELKMAMRGRPDLKRAIGPSIRAYEAEADEFCLKVFADTGLGSADLLAIRAIHSAVLRGLAIEQIDAPREIPRERIRDLFTAMALSRAGRRK